MKITPKLRRKLIVGGAFFAFVATPSFALFGLGDIVFDPTEYAQLIIQGTTAYNHYRSFIASMEHFTAKKLWQTELAHVEHPTVGNQFGETAGLTAALNTNSPASAQAAWTNSSVPLNSGATAYLSGQPPNNASRSQLALIEASDAASPNCINAVGAYRAARDANATAQQNLQSQQLDGSDDTNSEVQQLNLLNASQAQHLVELQAQGVIHACLAQQMAIQNMQQRNAAADDLNTKGFIQQQHQMNNAYPTNGSDTWTTFLP